MKGLLKEVFPITGTDKEFGCVYSITFNPAARVYIGKTMGILRRVFLHKHSLERRNHYCLDMQLDFNNYGWSAFSIHIIDTVEKKNKDARNMLKEMEISLIKSTNPFYNTDFRASAKGEQNYGAAKILLSKEGAYALLGNRPLLKMIAIEQGIGVRILEKWVIEKSDNLTKASILNLIHKETGIPMADLLTEKLTA